MNFRLPLTRCPSALALLALPLLTPATAAELPPAIRGSAAVMIQPEPGADQIRLTLSKRDLNLYDGADRLVIELFDPVRSLLAREVIEDDGVAGKGGPTPEPQTLELIAPVTVPGSYRLEATAATSSEAVWGFAGNVSGIMVDGFPTLNEAAAAASLTFAPPAGRFTITMSALHEPGQQQVGLFDEAGTLLHTFELAKPGEDAVLEVPETQARGGLWRLDVAHLDIKVDVGGVGAWSPSAETWFPADESRFLLFPYTVARCITPGQTAAAIFEMRNRTGAAANYDLTLETPPGVEAKLEGPARIAVGPKQVAEVRVAAAWGNDAPAAEVVYLRAQHTDRPEINAVAAIELRHGTPAVGGSLDGPVVLEPYYHENLQYGYNPEYPTNEVHWDTQNRPVIRERTAHRYPTRALAFLEDGQWVERPFVDAIKAVYPDFRGTYFGGWFLGAKVGFDGQGGAYTLLRLIRENARNSVVLYTPDRGRTYQVVDLGDGSFNLEQFTGHNPPTGPPPILLHHQIADHPGRFASVNELYLFLPELRDGKLELGEPVLISNQDLGSCQHSGAPAATATRDGKTHIVWVEVTAEDVPGCPTYVATYDHATKKLSDKLLLGYAPPINDVHNVPGICLDSEGYLHVILGAHGEPFQYRRSLRPHDASAWTDPEPTLTAGRVREDTDADGEAGQTYLSLVCGPDDTLHIAYRQWRAGVDPYHDGALYAALTYQRKPKNGPWSEAMPRVIPARPGYSIYYHKLTLDRRGNLALAYCYYTADTTYQLDFPETGHHQAVQYSSDGGTTWKLAETSDLAATAGAE